MKLAEYLLLLGVFLFVSGCSGTKDISESIESSSKAPGIARSSNITITVPAGWREIEDNSDKMFEIWLVNNDNSASICFIPINLDSRFNNKNSDEKLDLIEKMLINKNQSGEFDFEILSKNSERNSYISRSIKYLIDENLRNSIIFGRDNLYYECIAYSSENSEYSDSKMEEIFSVQNEIVNSVRIK